MKNISIQVAMQNMEYNYNRAEKYPEVQKEFEAEYMYANPNDYEAMCDLYKAYGYQYSRSLWAYQQVMYQKANEEDQKNNQ